MLDFRQHLLAKVEPTPGTDPTPAAGTNDIQFQNMKWRDTISSQETDEYTSSLDTGIPMTGGTLSEVSFDVWMNGSGTPETPPEWGVLLRACGWAETITSTAVPSSAEALASGSSTTQCTLGASATGTVDLYWGMPITFASTVTGDSFIASYSAAKLAVLTDTMGGNLTTTTTYQIPKNVLYRPSSSSIPSVSLWGYRDGMLRKGVGARGDMTAKWTNGQATLMSFRMMALWSSVTDTSLPAASTIAFQNQVKPIWLGSTNRARYNRVLVGLNSFTLNNGAALARPDNPEAAQGYDPAELTRRVMTADMDPLLVLKATRDAFGDGQAATRRIVHIRHGQTAGNRFGLTIPSAQVMDADPSGSRNGFAVENVRLRLTGADKGAAICQY